jgi:hypothetical protein
MVSNSRPVGALSLYESIVEIPVKIGRAVMEIWITNVFKIEITYQGVCLLKTDFGHYAPIVKKEITYPTSL